MEKETTHPLYWMADAIRTIGEEYGLDANEFLVALVVELENEYGEDDRIHPARIHEIALTPH